MALLSWHVSECPEANTSRHSAETVQRRITFQREGNTTQNKPRLHPFLRLLANSQKTTKSSSRNRHTNKTIFRQVPRRGQEEEERKTKRREGRGEKTQKVHRKIGTNCSNASRKSRWSRYRVRREGIGVETVYNHSREGEGGKKTVMEMMKNEKENKGLRGHTYTC